MRNKGCYRNETAQKHEGVVLAFCLLQIEFFSLSFTQSPAYLLCVLFVRNIPWGLMDVMSLSQSAPTEK